MPTTISTIISTTSTTNNIDKQHQQHEINNHNKNKKNTWGKGIKSFENIFQDIQRYGGNRFEEGIPTFAKSVSSTEKASEENTKPTS